jgi:serine/threonine-protein kinase
MAEHSIKLPKGEWIFDDQKQLGKPGGFGDVFLGSGSSGIVAIKRLKLSAGEAAHRELSVGGHLSSRELAHVVPVIDFGQDSQSDRYYLVMPKCERSLQDELEKADGGLTVEQSVSAIRAIVAGLLEVRELTHRDLKPQNVLYHAGVWKIADFGIAKFVEDSTSLETLRESLTPSYAAPEQWLNERPTSATDVYALGCIAHAVCNGRPPFQGGIDELRESHLSKIPHPIAKLPARLSSFVTHMLRKPQASRPTLERCREVFNILELEKKSASASRSRLFAAANVVADIEARAEAERELSRQARKRRLELLDLAKSELLAIRDRLFGELKLSSESVAVTSDGVEFGSAKLRMASAFADVDEFFRMHSAVQSCGWNILTSSYISVAVSKGYVWSASLIFSEEPKKNGFRWYEVAFWSMSGQSRDVPFFLPADNPDLYWALGPALHSVNVAYGPVLIDAENEHEFLDRWIGLVADAAIGKLTRPSSLPIYLPRG